MPTLGAPPLSLFSLTHTTHSLTHDARRRPTPPLSEHTKNDGCAPCCSDRTSVCSRGGSYFRAELTCVFFALPSSWQLLHGCIR